MISTEILQEMVKQAGGVYVGVQETPKDQVDLLLFNDPETGSTISVKLNIATVNLIKAKMLCRRMQFIKDRFPKTAMIPEIHLEVHEIRNKVNKLHKYIRMNPEGLEQLTLISSRLAVLARYLKQK